MIGKTKTKRLSPIVIFGRDREVTEKLTSEGWIVLRFWGNEIKKDLLGCADKIEAVVRSIK